MLEKILKNMKYLFTFDHMLQDGFSKVRNKDQLNQTQEKVLLYIGENPGLTLKELSRDAILDMGAMSRTIQQLTVDGYVVRNTDSDDRRKVLIDLTGLGGREVDRINSQLHILTKKKLSPLSAEDLKRLSDALDVIADITVKLGEEE